MNHFKGSENWVDNMNTDADTPSPDWSGGACYRFMVGFLESEEFNLLWQTYCKHAISYFCP